MKKIKIFCDASYKPETSSYGALFSIYKDGLNIEEFTASGEFRAESNLSAEFFAVLLALDFVDNDCDKLQIYSDCNLLSRVMNNQATYPESLYYHVQELNRYASIFYITWHWLSRKDHKIRKVHELAFNERIKNE